MKMKCPCCEGTGEIEDVIPMFLTPNQRTIYSTVMRSKGGAPGTKLVDALYSHRADGGPLFAWDSLHVTIYNMNKLLASIGERLCADKRGSGAVYRLHRNVV
jgi:hypothetical protein